MDAAVKCLLQTTDSGITMRLLLVLTIILASPTGVIAQGRSFEAAEEETE